MILLSILKPSQTLGVIEGSSLTAVVDSGLTSCSRGTSGSVSVTSGVGRGCGITSLSGSGALTKP